MESVNTNRRRSKQVLTTLGGFSFETESGKGPNLRWFFWLPALLSVVIVVVTLAALVLVSAHSVQRLTPIQNHLKHIERLQKIGLHMDEMLRSRLQQGEPVTQADLGRLQHEVRTAGEVAPDIYPETTKQLAALQGVLASSQQLPLETLRQATDRLHQLVASEQATHNDLVDTVERDSQLELKLALLLALSMPLITLMSFYLLKRRIKRPLDDLNKLLQRLAERDYQPVAETQVDEIASLIQPVYRSYNALVNRLAKLEAEHRAMQSSLEEDVKRATSALLEQAGDLARAEKLATVGELSAAMAHEIRNPLAGIQLACSKLGRQLTPEQQRKIDMVVSELRRVNNLLGERLYEARHAPESPVDVDVGDLIASLVALLKYQVHEQIDLEIDVTPGLVCSLPESGLRQSLLNLVMNAAKAIGDGAGRITLFAKYTDDCLEIGVSDTGSGFPQQILEQGVRPFVSGRVDGTGLGLAIVQRFTRTFFGDLRLENRPQGGACVTLLLPCSVNQQLDSGARPTALNRGATHG